MVEKWLSAFLDQALPRDEAESVSQHLSGCRECAARLKELVELRKLLRGLPEERIPVKLASQLQVMASREQARRIRTRWQNCLSWMRLVIDNMMRPVAIPLAGGITTALVLFSMLAPYLTVRAANFDSRTDVPFDWLSTQGTMIETPLLEGLEPFGFRGDEVEVLLTIDSNGQITDYSCANGKIDREVIDNIGNSLLFSSFEPPTMFGRPMSGKIRVRFRKVGDHIVVRG
jgi:hypothetical protein